MKRKIFCCLAVLLLSVSIGAQSWLPSASCDKQRVRLLGCQYAGARLQKTVEVDRDNPDWSVKQRENSRFGGTDYVFTAKRSMKEVGVAVALDCPQWSSDNYVMIPSVVYGGNRQRIVNREYATGLDATDFYRSNLALTSNPIPQLSPEFGSKSMIEVNVSNCATPAIVFFERARKCATILFTDQGIRWQGEVKDHALIVEESPDRSMATMVISAPGVRSRKPEFIGFSDSPDRGVSVKEGDTIVIRVDIVGSFRAEQTTDVLNRFMVERKRHTVSKAPRNLMPMSEVLGRMRTNIEERFFSCAVGEYYCPENADWMSFGWIGGLMNTYPMLAIGDDKHLERVASTFDFGLKYGQAKSGYFYDVVGKDGKPLYRDGGKNNPNSGLTRKNADVLYWMVKQFMLMRSMGYEEKIKPEWENAVGKLADAFVATWKKRATWGNYIDIETGDVAVYNTTGGALAPGGLALASKYFDNEEYLRVARSAADDYYRKFALLGFTSGGCGDILQNADSETACAMMTSMITLYEVTGEEHYLHKSADLANLCATWTVSFPYELPESTPLYKLGANLTGAVWASTQNKHGAPGFCTQSGDALFKIYRATQNDLYAELLHDIIHAHAEGIQPNGKITERLTYCDADSRGSRLDGGKTGWNETNGALMSLEIPGLYVRKDLRKAYMFDHLVIEKIWQKGNRLCVNVYNPTDHDALLTVFAEDEQQARQPLGDNSFLTWTHKTLVKKGKSAVVEIR